MKILIIRFSSIGDIVWTFPVIRCCKLQIPGVELHFSTKYAFRHLLENNPYIDKIHYLKDQSIEEYITELKKENFDFVIDLHNKLRSVWIKIRLGKKSFTYNKLNFRRFLFTKFQLKVMPSKIHVVDRYMATVKPLGVVNDGKGLDFFISPENNIDVNTLPPEFRNGYAAFIIGGSKQTKILPLQKMAKLCYHINFPIVLIGGKEDLATAQELENYLLRTRQEKKEKPLLYIGCGKYNILQSASVISQANVVFGHDTGLTHLAPAFKKKVYSIWGPTSPVGFAPYMGNNVIMENENLACRPCSKSGRDTCPLGHFKCMKEINFSKYFC